LDTLTAFNLTALFNGPALSPTNNQHRNSFVASKLVPFATHFTTQILECPAYLPTRQLRFIVYVFRSPIFKASRKPLIQHFAETTQLFQSRIPILAVRSIPMACALLIMSSPFSRSVLLRLTSTTIVLRIILLRLV
jgi:hypothetical protein